MGTPTYTSCWTCKTCANPNTTVARRRNNKSVLGGFSSDGGRHVTGCPAFGTALSLAQPEPCGNDQNPLPYLFSKANKTPRLPPRRPRQKPSLERRISGKVKSCRENISAHKEVCAAALMHPVVSRDKQTPYIYIM